MTAQSWSGRAAFFLATVGSAVGLGSIWKFPYMVGENGGGAFFLLYLVGLALAVLPLMIAEFAIGRAGQGSAVGSIARVAEKIGNGLAGAGDDDLIGVDERAAQAFRQPSSGRRLARAHEAGQDDIVGGGRHIVAHRSPIIHHFVGQREPIRQGRRLCHRFEQNPKEL